MAVLFDIDGTLLDTRGVGRASFARAVERATGQRDLLTHISFAGNTDLRAVQQMQEKSPVFHTEESIRQLWEYLAEEMEARLRQNPAREIPGARSLLEALAKTGTSLGLVTGNIRTCAFLKLASIHLDTFFSFGGYGDTHADRAEIAKAAIVEGRRQSSIRPDEPFALIGDTPFDVAAGKACGLPVLAVATCPPYPESTLREAGADLVLPNLQDTRTILDWLVDRQVLSTPWKMHF